MKISNHYFLEQVVTNAKGTQGYSLPDVITDTDDVQTLIDIIDGDSELFKMVYAVDPGYNKFKAVDIWKKIINTPQGQSIVDKYPDVVRFRISSSRVRGAGFEEGSYPQQNKSDSSSTRPIDVYDKKANGSSGDIGSFYDFFTSNKLRSSEVSGGAPADVIPS